MASDPIWKNNFVSFFYLIYIFFDRITNLVFEVGGLGELFVRLLVAILFAVFIDFRHE